MAKWGEGDPRWIVEERADATNVNNWHWTERDATSWSSDKLRELLSQVKVEGPEGSCQITEVKLEGEASVNNRKAKLTYFYGWVVTASWLGTSKTGAVNCKGSVRIPNLSDENDMDELDISVSLCKDDPAAAPLVSLMRKEGVQRVRTVLGQYVTQLKAEFAQGMILPSAKQGIAEPTTASKPPPPKVVVKSDQTQMTSTAPSPSSSAPCTTVRIPTGSFSLKDVFLTSPRELYRTLTTQEFVQAFTHSAAVVEGRRGGRFQILGGNVSGEFQELVPDEKIVMKWRFKTWPCDHHATISLFLEERRDETELRLECKGVPSGEEESTREGWKRYYFEAIKQTFGYGNRPLPSILPYKGGY